MRRFVPFGLMAMLFLILVPTLQAQDVTGDWTLTFTRAGRGGGAAMEVTQEFTFVLGEDGKTVTGTTMMAMRGGRGGGEAAPAPQEIAISDGMFEGGTLTFTISQSMGERTMTTTYTATVTGDTMEGSFARGGGMGGGMGAGEPTPFKGTRK